MTPSEFEQLLKPRDLDFMYTAADGMRLADALSQLNEAERKKLLKTARDFWKKAHHGRPFSNDIEFAGLAILAIGPSAEVRKVNVSHIQRQGDAVVKILIDRRPEWIDEWINHKLSLSPPQISWNLLRELIHAKVCQKPDHPGYCTLMIGMGWYSQLKNQVPLSQTLLDEPDLIEDIWKLFEHNVAPFYEGGPWGSALADLAEKQVLDRHRLLNGALRSLHKDLRSDGLAGYMRFYQDLRPTREERIVQQPVFLELLSHRVSSVVAFALDELSQLDKQDALDGEGFLTSVKSVFALKPKTHPQKALKLIYNLARRHEELVPKAVNATLEAFSHTSTEVQGKAAELLEAWQSHLHRDHLVEIRERMAELGATARSKVEKILKERDSLNAPVMVVALASNVDGLASQLTNLHSQAGQIDGKWKQLAGVDEAFKAANEERLPSPAEFDLLDAPLLSATEPIVPIQSVDELFDAVAHAIEVLESADEMERILDGISRLCDQEPADFHLRAAPLIGRMTSDITGDSNRGLRSPASLPVSVRGLILSWLHRRLCPVENQPWGGSAMYPFAAVRGFIDVRMDEMESRVIKFQTAPLLAAPTHRRGWIEPREFIRRFKLVSAKGEVPRADLIQALLRLAPDNRDRALSDAKDISGDMARAVRWALGSDGGPITNDQEMFPIWLAAGRARQPQGTLDQLAEIVPEKIAEFALLPPTYTWRPQRREDKLSYRRGGEVGMRVDAHPAGIPSSNMWLYPALALYEPAQRNTFGFDFACVTDWLTSVWPLNTDPRLSVGAELLCQRVNAPASTYEPNYIYLAPLLEPDRPWTELAYLVAWIALISKDADSHGAGIDALILAIEDGRADPTRSAQVLLQLLSGDWVKLNRVSDACRDIARLSPLHTWWMAEMLQRFLAGIEEAPNDVYHLLALLVELLSELQITVDSAASQRLASVKLGGKGAKLLQQLLKLEFPAISDKASAALLQAIRARLERAERWSRANAFSN
jgi:hypothetical protein